MSQLSAQSILRYCSAEPFGFDDRFRHNCPDPERSGAFLPMISPFVEEKTIFNGMSYGLSATSYDLRIAHDLVVGPTPGEILKTRLEDAPRGLGTAVLGEVWHDVRRVPAMFSLAVSMERFAIPWNVSGRLCDKSTRARQGLSCFNTLFDPGFIGFATLEIVNLSDSPIVIQAGEPIAQMIFTWLDEPTDRPYSSKYQNAPQQAVEAILEEASAA